MTGKPDYTRLDLPAPPDQRPYVLINMVMSADGRTAVEGTERGLGSPTDQRLMRELRVNADVVMNGAATMRASGTSSRLDQEELETIRLRRGKTAAPIAAVLTRSGDLPPERRFFTATNFDAVVYLSSAAPAQRRAALEALGRPIIEVPDDAAVPAALRHMRQELGASVLLLEGGSTINGDFFRHDLVDEYFLTLAPRIVGGETAQPAVIWPGEPTRAGVRQMELLQATPNAETGEIYARYRVRR